MQENKLLPLYLRVWRAIALYAVFVAISAAACFFYIFFSYSLTDRPLGDSLDRNMFLFPFAVQSIIIYLFLGSLLRVFAQRDAAMHRDIYPGAKQVSGFADTAKTVLRSKLFYTELITLGILPLILPLECGFYPLTFLLFSGTALTRAVQKLILLCITWPLLFGMSLWHHVDAVFVWQEAEIAGRQDNKRELAAPVASTAALYFVCLLLIPPALSVLMLALSFLASVSFSLVGLVILACVVLCLLWRYLRALRIRRKFLKNLRERCEKCGFALSAIRRPYRSVLRIADGCDFTVSANGKTYSCKLLAGLSRSNAMSLSPDGIAHVIHVWGLRIIPGRRMHASAEFLGGTGRALGGSRWYQKLEIFRFTTKTDFSFEGEGCRILIVNPVPFALFAGTEGNAQPIDNGAAVGPYKVFSGTAFLNALERDCIEKT